MKRSFVRVILASLFISNILCLVIEPRQNGIEQCYGSLSVRQENAATLTFKDGNPVISHDVHKAEVIVEGTCCFYIFRKKHFKGRYRKLHPARRHYSIRYQRMRSIRMSEC